MEKLQRADATKLRCQVLNPNVELSVDKEDLATKEETFFRAFDLVILVDQKYSLVEKVNEICRKLRIR